MSLVKVTCELRYAQRMALLKGHEEIFRRLLGEEPKDRQNWLMPGIRIDNQKNKEVVIIDPQRTIVELQDPGAPAHATETLRQRFHVIEEIFGIPELVRWGVRTAWVSPFEGDIQALIGLFKKRAFHGFLPAVEASDVGFMLDFQGTNESEKITVLCGPMWPEQLRQRYLPLGIPDLPKAFVLADVDLGATAPVAYTQQTLGRFLTRGVEVGEKYSDTCYTALLRGEG
jgi:hypothetical protein